ncbi:MAG: DUF2249 domain-containing protein [SAR324 cluster bacterium]|nr:DUF2249 domain-containing protein [SAR324 cluster bacterium]
MDEIITIDCRYMEPPEPMVRVLEAVEALKLDQKICMIHRKKPVPLFDKLSEKGMDFDWKDLGSHYEILIWKLGPNTN